MNLSKFIFIFCANLQDTGELTISSIADIFDHTENDVRRALVYWEKQGLLILSRDSSGEIREIAFHRSLGRPQTKVLRKSRLLPKPRPLTQSPPGEKDDRDASSHSPQEASRKVPKREPLTADRIDELRKQEDIEQLLFIAAQYIGRPFEFSGDIRHSLLRTTDCIFPQISLSILWNTAFPRETKAGTTWKKVAIGWAGDGILHRPAEAKAQHRTSNNKKYYSSFKMPLPASKNKRARGPPRTRIHRTAGSRNTSSTPSGFIVEACQPHHRPRSTNPASSTPTRS